jgi:hypothetical protein
MLIETLTLLATSALAYGAISISKQANSIAEKSVTIEVDKHIFEWGQRCLNCASRVSSLRMLPDGKMKDAEFEEERRLLYAEFFALKEEGTLFFEKTQSKPTAPCILALKDAIKYASYDKFLPPQADDAKERYASNNEFRKHVRKFSAAIQSRVGNQWAEN